MRSNNNRKCFRDEGKHCLLTELPTSNRTRSFSKTILTMLALLCVLFVADRACAVTLKKTYNRAQAWFDDNQVPQFSSTILKSKVKVEVLSPSKTHGKVRAINYRLTLSQLPEKIIYVLYRKKFMAEIKPSAGYVETHAFMNQWQDAVSQGRPSIVFVRVAGISLLVAVHELVPVGDNGWQIIVQTVVDNPKSQIDSKQGMLHKEWAAGTYNDVYITSDLFPFDVRPLPRSLCPLDIEEEACKKKPLQIH
jgi:hypothetical protein